MRYLPSRDRPYVSYLLILKVLNKYIGSGAIFNVLMSETGMSSRTLSTKLTYLMTDEYILKDMNHTYHMTGKGVGYRDEERRHFARSEELIEDARNWPNIVMPGTYGRATIVLESANLWAQSDIENELKKVSEFGPHHGWLFRHKEGSKVNQGTTC